MSSIANALARARPLIFSFLVILIISWAVVSLSYPFGWDQAIFAWIAEGINQGQIPYRDRWDVKGPLTYYIYAFAQRLFGTNLWGIRVFDLLFILTTAYVLLVLTSRLTSKTVAQWAAVLLILWYATGSFWHTAQPDGWVAMLMLLALAPLVARDRRLHWPTLLLTGTFVGCATLIKPFYALFIFVPVLAIRFHSGAHEAGPVVRYGPLFVGLLIPLSLCVGWFAYRNALQSLIDVWIIYTLNAYVPPASRIKGLVEHLLNTPIISMLVPVAGLGMLSLWRSNRPAAIVTIAWLLVSLFCIILQNRYFRYHWSIFYPPAALICAVGFHELFQRRGEHAQDHDAGFRHRVHLMASMLLGILIFHLTVKPAYEIVNWLAFASNRVSKNEYYAGFGMPGSEIQAAEYIKTRTESTDHVFVWGWNVAILYLSQRQTISRFGYSMPLLMGEGTKEREAYRQEFLTNLYKRLPVYIVVAPQSAVILGRDYDLSNFAELAEIVSTRYREERRFGNLILYRTVDR